ncbi:MAG: molybdopterin-guanine dinucleotide biosynthesis protein MobB [Chloroflexi bacterium]|nr:molybdopterin-guanine dinucleotide biosynthesis protein MobB [Chloroflexota bacterium]
MAAQLKGRGYRLATIKHSKEFHFEAEGKDSWRLAQAGCTTVHLDSPQRLAIVEQLEHDISLEVLTYRTLGRFDLMFTEGFRKTGAVKIKVHRSD